MNNKIMSKMMKLYYTSAVIIFLLMTGCTEPEPTTSEPTYVGTYTLTQGSFTTSKGKTGTFTYDGTVELKDLKGIGSLKLNGVEVNYTITFPKAKAKIGNNSVDTNGFTHSIRMENNKYKDPIDSDKIISDGKYTYSDGSITISNIPLGNYFSALVTDEFDKDSKIKFTLVKK